MTFTIFKRTYYGGNFFGYSSNWQKLATLKTRKAADRYLKKLEEKQQPRVKYKVEEVTG